MAYTKTDIVNRALMKLSGATDTGTVLVGTISAAVFTDYTTASDDVTKMAAFVYPQVRKEILCAAPKGAEWKFARKYVELTTALTAGTIEECEWEYLYDLPSDFLAMIKVTDEEDHTEELDHDIRSNETNDGWILMVDEYSNEDNDGTFIEYIWDNDNPATYTPQFVNAFAVLLAAEMAAYVKDKVAADQLRNEYDKYALPQAIEQHQRQAYIPKRTSWKTARGS